jgi:TonB family protein
VSDFLKHVMAVSDHAQTGNKTDSEEMDSLILELAASEKTDSTPENNDVQLEPGFEPARFESRDAMLAEYMTIQEKTPESENLATTPGAGLEFGCFEDRDADLAEFMPPKEAVPSAQDHDMPSDAGVEASQFEALDAMLAEFITLQKETPPAEADIAPVSTPAPPHAKSEEVSNQPVKPEPPQVMAPSPEYKCAALKPVPISQKTEALPCDIRKPETKSPAVIRVQAEKNVLPKSPPGKAASKRARPAPEARAINAKTLLIAAACVCVLAVLAVPGRYFPGGSQNASKPAGGDASSTALPSQPAQPVLISQVSPKYPELAVKNRASASVTLDLSINSEGSVVEATPVSGPDLFHEEAIRAAMKWRYKPASTAGSNAPRKSRVTLSFSLKN